MFFCLLPNSEVDPQTFFDKARGYMLPSVGHSSPSSFSRRRRRAPHTFVLQSVTSHIPTSWLCCPPVFSPGLKGEDFLLTLKSMMEITGDGFGDSSSQNQFEICSRSFDSVLLNINHSTSSTKAFSTFLTSSKFRHPLTYRKSPIPFSLSSFIS